MLERLRYQAGALKLEAIALSYAGKDPRTPWYAKGLIFFVAAHTLSPIDLIPDFIPVLGYLDDLIITPGGLWLAVRLIPPEVLAEARVTAAARSADGSMARIGTVIVIVLWLLAAVTIVSLILYFTKRI